MPLSHTLPTRTPKYGCCVPLNVSRVRRSWIVRWKWVLPLLCVNTRDSILFLLSHRISFASHHPLTQILAVLCAMSRAHLFCVERGLHVYRICARFPWFLVALVTINVTHFCTTTNTPLLSLVLCLLAVSSTPHHPTRKSSCCMVCSSR